MPGRPCEHTHAAPRLGFRLVDLDEPDTTKHLQALGLSYHVAFAFACKCMLLGGPSAMTGVQLFQIV